MDNFLDKSKAICRSLGIFEDRNYEKLHPRIFTGVCIKFLKLSQLKNQKKSKCMDGEQCKLNHFKKNFLIQAINLTPINGVLPFNLCPQAEECMNLHCQFLHREWINDKKVCLKNLVGECYSAQEDSQDDENEEHQEDEEQKEDEDESQNDQNQVKCKREHISWNALQQKVQNDYQAFGLTLESLCLKNSNECKINCQGHSKYLDDYCILNFRGICEFNKNQCLKVQDFSLYCKIISFY